MERIHLPLLPSSPLLIAKILLGKKLLATLLLLLLACSAAPNVEGKYHTVRRVVDGDTIVLENGERVRLLGVDTPETVDPRRPVGYFGKEASELTKRIVEGKRVRLEFDPVNAHRGHKDNTRERRTLAYVFLEDGTDLNAAGHDSILAGLRPGCAAHLHRCYGVTSIFFCPSRL